MKKAIFLLFVVFLLFSFTKNKNNVKQNNEGIGRQCCTVTANFNGGMISVTACAGWVFSNNANAYQRACDKAWSGLEAAIQ